MSGIKELRKEKGLTQAEASKITKIPLRTFKLYENDDSKVESIKYKYIVQELEKHGIIDEEHGVLNLDKIIAACKKVFIKYDVEYAILFGSYAKETAGEKSDVDILLSAPATGLRFFALAEELRKELKKKVDLLDISQLEGNFELTKEILKTGVRLYG